MKRRILIPGLTFLSSYLALAGCDWPHHSLRKNDRDPDVAQASAKSEDAESNKVLDVTAEPSRKKPFFSSSRLPSGLSDEARDIESHMGIQ
jgi:hypothetical protein